MYISKVEIENIKCIEHLELQFDQKPGWHVILGDNGTGKSTILKCISGTLNSNFRKQLFDFQTNGKNKGSIDLQFCLDNKLDIEINLTKEFEGLHENPKKSEYIHIEFSNKIIHTDNEIVSAHINSGYFSCGFGPNRRIGDKWINTKNGVKHNRKQAHITLFYSEYTFESAINWLQDLDYKQKDNNFPEQNFTKILDFINKNGLLPNQTKISKVNSDGVFFEDENGVEVDIYDLSDGYQSVFSLTMEIIRQMTIQYDFEMVFSDENFKNGSINLPGVVLIDEVDIHLHPSWQAKIGDWFKKYFPQIQFIVTTHSPIICRSAENSHIWKLEHKNAAFKTRRLKDDEYNRLVYGSILDAYGTEIFGKNITRHPNANKMLNELAKLNMLETVNGKLDEDQKKQQLLLQKTFSSYDSFDF